MAKRLLDAFGRIVRKGACRTRRPMGRTVVRISLAFLLLMVLYAGILWTIDTFPVQARQTGLFAAAQTIGLVSPARCGSLCQACYCEDIINGQCYVNGRPSRCIGCVGSCVADYDCNCRAGRGGCGRYVMWCRDSDCAPSVAATATPTATAPPPTATPAPSPTPTPPPPVCDAGFIYVDLEKPQVTQVEWDPLFPVLDSQDQGDPQPGVDFFTWAGGGRATKYQTVLEQRCRNGGTFPADCPSDWEWVCYDKIIEGPYDDPIVRLDIFLPLSSGSSTWIQDDLANRYYDAYKRQEAFYTNLSVPYATWTGSAQTLYFEFLDWPPPDPGVYKGIWEITTQGTPLSQPQVVRNYHLVEVYLRDTTLLEP